MSIDLGKASCIDLSELASDISINDPLYWQKQAALDFTDESINELEWIDYDSDLDASVIDAIECEDSERLFFL